MATIPQAVTIQNVPISNLNETAFFSIFHEFIKSNETHTIFFANAHVLNVAQTDPGLMQALKEADLVLADGMGLKIAGKVLGQPFKANLNGTDLLPKILSLAAEAGITVFFLGGELGIAEQAKFELQKRIPRLCVVGSHHGFFDDKNVESLIENINMSGADLLLVGLGVPKQEKWIWQFRNKLRPKLLCGVGAFLDFSAGRFPRAPLFMRQIGLEWIFRFYKEPRRLFKRYILGNPIFLGRIIMHRFFS